jgi:hypothetical protein
MNNGTKATLGIAGCIAGIVATPMIVVSAQPKETWYAALFHCVPFDTLMKTGETHLPNNEEWHSPQDMLKTSDAIDAKGRELHQKEPHMIHDVTKEFFPNWNGPGQAVVLHIGASDKFLIFLTDQDRCLRTLKAIDDDAKK